MMNDVVDLGVAWHRHFSETILISFAIDHRFLGKSSCIFRRHPVHDPMINIAQIKLS